jgi:small GTP-binding protein
MPTNVTGEYMAAEEEYRIASNRKEKLAALQKMFQTVPKHKGTEKLRLQIRRKMAKMRGEIEAAEAKKGGGPSFNVKKEGAAQVALVGFPSVGKSLILTKLTNAYVVVGSYDFTTTMPTPGMLLYNDIQIQIVEVPGLIEGASEGRGFGTKLMSAIRVADACIFIVDLSGDIPTQMRVLLNELEKSNIKINKKRKDVEIKRLSTGGIEVRGARLFAGSEADIRAFLTEERIHNALVVFKEPTTIEEFEECLNLSLTYLPAFIIANKMDIPGAEETFALLRKNYPQFTIIPLSAVNETDLGEMKREIYHILDIIRIFTKTPGEEPAYPPIAIARGSSVIKVAEKVHKQFARDFKYARVWGKSVKYKGQRVGGNHVLEDGDIVEIHIK